MGGEAVEIFLAAGAIVGVAFVIAGILAIPALAAGIEPGVIGRTQQRPHAIRHARR